jgi:DNA repair protein RecN (Recombination protein N)
LRSGTERGLIEATFAVNPKLSAWLATHEIDSLDDDTIICSREITSKSSRTRLNGVVVNKHQIQDLREQLVEITAQGQTVLLGRESMQREWLDNFGGIDLLQLRPKIAQLYEVKARSQLAVTERQTLDRNRLQQIDILQFQLQELDEANLEDPDELVNLDSDRNRLAYSVELQQQSYNVYEALYQNESGSACADLLGKAEAVLKDMVEVDANLGGVLDLVSSAMAQVEEAGRQINAYGDSLESDPEQLQNIEDRIRQLKQICRKYGATLPEAIAYAQKLEHDLAALTGDGQSLEDLEKIAETALKALVQACSKLTKLREKSARELEQKLIVALKSLAMDKVQFRVAIAPIEPAANGADRITFEFSPNPGEPLQPISETASGGEISRFLLALKTCFAQADPIGTLVFDEIDVGVSGRVSQAIAYQLFQLSRNHQVLCVTHQPIVAAIADHHFQVSKQVSSNGSATSERTTVQIQLLQPEQRKQELAQIAGGLSLETKVEASKKRDKTKDSAIAFAESLLEQAASMKQQQFLR